MKELVTKYLFDYDFYYPKIKQSWVYKIFGDSLFHPRLWSIDSNSLAKAWLIGMIVSSSVFIGLHVAIALTACLIFRAHIPLAAVLQAWSNPLIIPLYFPLAYKLGCWILHIQPVMSDDHPLLQGNYMIELHNLEAKIWPLFLGCTVVGIIMGGLGYIFIHVFIKERALFHYHKK